MGLYVYLFFHLQAYFIFSNLSFLLVYLFKWVSPSSLFNMSREDRQWMYQRLDGRYLSKEYIRRVEEFIKQTSSNPQVCIDGLMKCPCIKCGNRPWLEVKEIKLHLFQQGFCKGYYRWTYHGENDDSGETSSMRHPVQEHESNRTRDMVLDAFMSSREFGANEINEEPHEGQRHSLIC